MSSHCELKKLNLTKKEKLLKSNLAIYGKQIPIFNGKKINRNENIWKHFKDFDMQNYYCIEESNYFLHNELSIYK